MSPRRATRLRAAPLWGAAVALAACGADPAALGDAGVDAPVDAATDAPDLASCATPDACDWLAPYLTEVLGTLTGEQPAAPGVTITRRASSGERAIARQYLVDELTRRGLAPTLHDYGSGQNVVVQLPSTTGADLPRIVIGAHFDGVPAGPAAADNGTGTAIVVAAARYLAARPRRDHPIDLVLFDQEEVGLVGSTAYALALRDAAVAVDSVHSFDMISFDGDGDGAIELWSPAPELEALYRAHAGPRGIPVGAVAFASSDHQAFVDRGFTTVGVCEEFVAGDANPHYHRATDTFANVDLAYMTRVTRLLLAVLEDRATTD